jgi:hypothetical protein
MVCLEILFIPLSVFLFYNPLGFAMDGDLDQGLKLIAHTENLKLAAANKANGVGGTSAAAADKDKDADKMEASADDAWYFAQKVEKGLVKIVSGNNAPAATGGASAEDVEQLRRTVKKLQKELADKDKQLAAAK